jgi:hypothetical protein
LSWRSSTVALLPAWHLLRGSSFQPEGIKNDRVDEHQAALEPNYDRIGGEGGIAVPLFMVSGNAVEGHK